MNKQSTVNSQQSTVFGAESRSLIFVLRTVNCQLLTVNYLIGDQR